MNLIRSRVKFPETTVSPENAESRRSVVVLRRRVLVSIAECEAEEEEQEKSEDEYIII